MGKFGDKLFDGIYHTRSLLYAEGELANLTVIANNKFITLIEQDEQENIDIEHPVGWIQDNTPINSTYNYTKDELINRYRFMSETKLPLDGIYRLVTIVETLLNFVFKNVLIEFPSKIPKKKKIDASIALEADSIESIKLRIIDNVLNEIAYKSPREYAEEFKNYIGINLLENPIFHKYIELKATRDIHIHNAGTANDIYLNKSGPLARVQIGKYLPVTVQYFLQSYESCLQLTENLETELNKIWPSIKYQQHKQNLNTKGKDKIIEENVDQFIEDSQKKISNSTEKRK